MPDRLPDVVALLTCHDRREMTLRCLERLFAQERDASISVVLVDDASTDGTAGAIGERFPGVTVVEGDGNLFWAAGMAIADREAWKQRPDFLLWLNDDTHLDPDALARLIAVHGSHRGSIVAGAVRDPDTGAVTYGGLRRRGRYPLRLERLHEVAVPTRVDGMNGNVVLVPAGARAIVGPIDGLFAHTAGDIDYAYRANRLGVDVFVAPGTVGTCRRNPAPPPPESVRSALREIFDRRDLPPRSRHRFLRRHAPAAWPVYFAWAYSKGIPLAVVRGLAGRHVGNAH